MTEAATAKKKPKSGWLNVAVDYGPLLVFFLVYKYHSPDKDVVTDDDVFAVLSTLAVMWGTGAFIVASLVALAVSKFMLGKVSPMLWLSTLLIVGFGALTIYFRDPLFIQWKPTIIYVLFAVVLLVGYAKGKSLLKVLLEAAFEGLSDEGWLKLSRNWGLFFIVLAVLNTVLLFVVSFETWLEMKLWLFMPLTFLFTFTQVPMLMRHGLSVEDNDPADDTPPPG